MGKSHMSAADRQPLSWPPARVADRAWDQGHFDVSVLADYLAGLLKDQLAEQATAP